MAEVQFEDFSIQAKEALSEAIANGLELAAAEIQKQAVQNSRIDTGQLKGSWAHTVDESAQKATIGSPLENAIWEEFGTGEYAAHEDGRKGGWYYVDDEGNGHFTHGKTPNHTLQRAFDTKKGVAERLIKRSIQEAMRGDPGD